MAWEAKQLRVSGAWQQACDGLYKENGTHNGRPLYRNEWGATVYFDEFWKMYDEESTTTWCFSVPGSEGKLPPEGKWTSFGYERGEGRNMPFVVLENVPEGEEAPRLPTPVASARSGRRQPLGLMLDLPEIGGPDDPLSPIGAPTTPPATSKSPVFALHGGLAAALAEGSAMAMEGPEPPPEPPPPDAAETSMAIHKELAAEASSPLELAALGRLCVWETGHAGYSIAELMDLARWVEVRMMQGPEPSDLVTTKKVARERKAYGVAFGAFAVATALIFLVFITVISYLCIAGYQNVAPEASGILRSSSPLEASVGPVAAVGAAVHLQSLAAFPNLQVQDLRRAQDIALTHKGAFHFYRIAGVVQLMSGSIKIEAEDGTTIRIQRDYIGLKRPWSVTEESVNLGEQAEAWEGAPWASSSAIRATAALEEG